MNFELTIFSLQIYDPNVERYEVPLNIPSPDTAASSPLYRVEVTETPSFGLRVIRQSTSEAV